MTFTPGPWKLENGVIFGADGYVLMGDTRDREEWNANTNLICASPALLNACYDARLLLRRLSACNAAFNDDINATLTTLSQAIQEAQSA